MLLELYKGTDRQRGAMSAEGILLENIRDASETSRQAVLEITHTREPENERYELLLESIIDRLVDVVAYCDEAKRELEGEKW